MDKNNAATGQPIRLAGKALIWQAIQMGGVKGIFLLRILVLARLLSPTDFGVFAIATTSMGFLLNITNLGMIPALIQGRETNEDQYNTAWTIGITRSALISVVLFATAPIIASLFGEPRSGEIVRVMALYPMLEALGSIKMADLNRNLLFRTITQLRIVVALVNSAVAIALTLRYGIWGLPAGMLAGAITLVAGSYIIAPHRPRLSFNQESIRPLVQFGRWIFFSSLITIVGSYTLRIVITRQLGASGLGLYYLATQLAFLPGEIASEVVGNVAFPLYARLQTNLSQATRVFKAMFTSLAALLFPASALIIVLAPGLTRGILGPDWTGTEPVIQILALVTMIGVFGEAAVPVLKGFGQPYRVTLLELIQSVTILGLVWVLTGWFGLVGAALAWLPAITFSQLLNAYFTSQILDQPFAGLLRPFMVVLFITGLSAAIAAGVQTLVPGMIGLLAAGFLSVLASYSLLWASDRRFSLGFIRNLVWAFPQMAARVGISSHENY